MKILAGNEHNHSQHSMPTLKQSTTTPCRLYVFLAVEAPIGVILRTGPTAWTQLIKWNTGDDTFEHGQWFHGRIVPETADLSPDGKHLVYFARKENQKTHADKEIGACWLAISRPPYFTAVALWKAYTSCDGGLFVTNEKILLSVLFANENMPPDIGTLPEQVKVFRFPFSARNAILRLLQVQTGWRPSGTNACVKDVPGSHWQLLVAFGEGSRGGKKRYTLVSQDQEVRIDRATWADCDKRGRLLFARDGKLFTLKPDSGLDNAVKIADFNAAKPEQIAPPDWAKVW